MTEHEFNTDLLEQIGQCLYGDQWQSNLARVLNIDSRRVRYWLTEDRPLPDWLKDELLKLLRENSEESQVLTERLERLK